MKNRFLAFICCILTLVLSGCIELPASDSKASKPTSSVPKSANTKAELITEYDTVNSDNNKSVSFNQHYKLSTVDEKSTEPFEIKSFCAQNLNDNGDIIGYTNETTTGLGDDESAVSINYCEGSFYISVGEVRFVSNISVDEFKKFLKNNADQYDFSSGCFKTIEMVKEEKGYTLKFSGADDFCNWDAEDMLKSILEQSDNELKEYKGITVRATFTLKKKLDTVELTIVGKNKDDHNVTLTVTMNNYNNEAVVSKPKEADKYKTIASAHHYPTMMSAISNYLSAKEQSFHIKESYIISDCLYPYRSKTEHKFKYTLSDDGNTFEHYKYDYLGSYISLYNYIYILDNGMFKTYYSSRGFPSTTPLKEEKMSEEVSEAYILSKLVLGYVDLSKADDISVTEKDTSYRADITMNPSWGLDILNTIALTNGTGHPIFDQLKECKVVMNTDKDGNLINLSYDIISGNSLVTITVTIE